MSPSSTSRWVRAHYQRVSCTISVPKCSKVTLSAPRKALYHLPWYCLILVHQHHIHNSEAFRSFSHQFFQCVLVINNDLWQLLANVAWVREGDTFPSSMRTLPKAKGLCKGVPAVDLSAILRSDSTPCQVVLKAVKNTEMKETASLPHYWPQSLLWPLIAMIAADVGHYGCSFLYIKVIRTDRNQRKWKKRPQNQVYRWDR